MKKIVLKARSQGISTVGEAFRSVSGIEYASHFDSKMLTCKIGEHTLHIPLWKTATCGNQWLRNKLIKFRRYVRSFNRIKEQRRYKGLDHVVNETLAKHEAGVW